MKYLIILLLAFSACSESDPQPKSCPELKAEAETAWKAWQANKSDKRLEQVWSQKNALVFERRCP